MSRGKYYGKLNTDTMPMPIRHIWYSKHQEPAPVERYELCDREWEDPTAIDRRLDRQTLALTLMDLIPERLSAILVMRYVDEMTLEQVGQTMGITRERVRQLEKAALRRVMYWMRNPDSLSERIKEFKERMKEQNHG